MSDALEKLKAKAEREAEKAIIAEQKRRAAENRVKKAERDRRHAMAIKLGYALLDEMDEKAGINRSYSRSSTGLENPVILRAISTVSALWPRMYWTASSHPLAKRRMASGCCATSGLAA